MNNRDQLDFDLVVDANHTELHYWRDLWHFRELFYFLAWRDILVRYKQTVIGIAWSIIRPLLTMIVFTVVFGKIAKLPSEGVPYPILVYVAMLPWQFFSTSLNEASNSLISNSNLLSKVYFPRLIIPISSIIVSLVDFCISAIILALLMIWYQIYPGWRILTLPIFLILAFLASLGLGLWLSALNIKYRDIRFIVPFLIQFGLYISPVGFSSSVIPPNWQFLYSLNPMVGIIDGFRWALIGENYRMNWLPFIVSVFLILGTLIFGLWYFRKTEQSFADVI